MRAVVQRVSSAHVDSDGHTTGRIDAGLVVLLGITHDDSPDQATRLAAKIHTLRILHGEQSIADTGDGVLVISQFTLYGDARKGRRPTWTAAAPGSVAEPLYEHFCAALTALGARVEAGVFGADMTISMVADGPVTILLEV